jgi:glutamate racemase
MPIGIFDSGVGGLTVMKEIIREMPDENIIYLGDTARVPYGTRSPETVIKYSLENALFLMSRGIKVLVVACNTSSSVSLPLLKDSLPVPVVGVVEPGARAAVAATRNKKVAVIGTETTVNTGAYEQAIKALDGSVKVSGIACPLFVPLIEEGWIAGEVVALTAEKYLSSISSNGADSLVLGCTHYPMIKNVIADTVKIPLIDSAVETAKEVKRELEQDGMFRKDRSEARREFFVTDAPEKFARTGERFLEHKIVNISKINLGG